MSGAGTSEFQADTDKMAAGRHAILGHAEGRHDTAGETIYPVDGGALHYRIVRGIIDSRCDTPGCVRALDRWGTLLEDGSTR